MTCWVDQRDRLLQQVDSITADIRVVQEGFNSLSDKVSAIRSDLDATTDGIRSDQYTLQQQEDPKQQHDQRNVDAMNATADMDESTGHHSAPKTSAMLDENYNIMCSLSVPPSLLHRWTREITRDTTNTRAFAHDYTTLKTSNLKWGSRWQDVFDSYEEEIDEDAREKRKSSSHLLKRGTLDDMVNFRRHGALMFHPHSRVRICWDTVGLLMLVYDAISIPIFAAWDRDLDGITSALFTFGLVYWTVDMFFSMNTGYFHEATLVFSRRKVILHYLQGWMPLDILLVSLDYAVIILPGLSDSGAYLFRSARIIRILRLVRGVRLFKMSRICLAAEEFLINVGGNYSVLTIAVLKTLIGIYFLSHIAACSWYFIGTSLNSRRSWVQLIENFQDASLADQYTRLLYWVLGHLVAAPVDPTVSPQNIAERVFTLCLIISSLLVIGISVSKMSETATALNKAYAEANDTKRKLQSYLHANSFPSDLSVRVVRHALEVYKKRSAMKLDPEVLGLLSSDLVSDINAWQYGKRLHPHPLFQLIKEAHPGVILELYSACASVVYADGDTVYKDGIIAEVLYVTVAGTFALHEFIDPSAGDATKVTVYETAQFFCEVSLFAHFYHRATLKTQTFADSLSIHTADFVACVQLVPSCIGTIYRYARFYLSRVVHVDGLAPTGYVTLDGKFGLRDVMPQSLAEEACDVARGSHQPILTDVNTPVETADTVHATVACIMEQNLSNEELVEKIELAFPEVRYEGGLYTNMSEPAERRRSLAAMLGLIWLSKDSYDSFIESQEESMTYQLWAEWQGLMKWANISREVLHALLVLLGIRGLGKVKAMARMVPPKERSPENIVLYLLENVPQAIPSTSHLSSDMLTLVKKVFETHKRFNLAQMLQGENTPYQVRSLKECIESHGEGLLEFYLLALVGMMCGLAGASTLRGCAFMDENNARNVLSCIKCLRQVAASEPHAIYWQYLKSRAKALSLPVATAEQLAFVRLACLSRVSMLECSELHETWENLDAYDKEILIDHLLADGIHERAFVLSFLPGYLLNAKKNRVVGSLRGFHVLIDLLVLLQSDGVVSSLASAMLVVNLSDIASFVNDVINPLAFESLAAHAKIVLANGELRVSVAASHWHASSNIHWKPGPMNGIAHEMKRMSRATRSVKVMVKHAVPARHGVVSPSTEAQRLSRRGISNSVKQEFGQRSNTCTSVSSL